MSYTKHKTIRWSVDPKNDSIIRINLICMTKDEDMMSKIELGRIRPGHALRNSLKMKERYIKRSKSCQLLAKTT